MRVCQVSEGWRKGLGWAEDSEGSGAGEEGKTIAHSRGLAGGQGGELRSSQVDWESAELRRDHLQGV